MRREDIPTELLELAREHGIDVSQIPDELTDEQLEAVVAGKMGPVGFGYGGWGWGGGFVAFGGGWGRGFYGRRLWW